MMSCNELQYVTTHYAVKRCLPMVKDTIYFHFLNFHTAYLYITYLYISLIIFLYYYRIILLIPVLFAYVRIDILH